MVAVIVFGVVVGGMTAGVLHRRRTRAKEREARSRERLAAIVLYEEVMAAIDGIDMALQGEGSKWLFSLSESTTLSEAWREQAAALMALDLERWHVLSDAVNAVAPQHRLKSANAHPEDIRRSLMANRELLIESAGILIEVRDARTPVGAEENSGGV